MFNREYQKRATKQGLAQRGGHRLAADAALATPWAGIFEPWRPFVLTAAAADPARAEKAFQRKSAAKRCKKSGQRLLFDGKLRGVQLSLFPDNDAQTFTAPEQFTASRRFSFPPLAGMVDPMAPEILTEDELAAEFEKLKALR